MKREIIIRHGKPSEYDQFPHLTLCKSMHGLENEFELYMQCAYDENHPRWELMGKYPTEISNETLLDALDTMINP